MTVAPRTGKGMEPRRESEGTLIHVVETLLDKGLVLNADIMVSVAGVELLGIRLRAALASFETAARYGLEFPAGTDTSTVAWREAIEQKETCPQCDKRAPLEMLMNEYCPWCGWQSAYALRGGGTARSDEELPAGRAEGSEDEAGEPSPETTPSSTSGEKSSAARSSAGKSAAGKSTAGKTSAGKTSTESGSSRKRSPRRSSTAAKPAEG